MWKLKIAEGRGPYLYSTNNFVGRQFWEYDADAGTPEVLEALEEARREFIENKKKGYHGCGDMFTRMQLKKESGIDLVSLPRVRVGETEEVSYEAATVAVKKALSLNRALQASDGHWPSEIAGPMFFTPSLTIALYISGAINTILTSEHRKEMVRYIYNHQNEDGGWGLHIEGHSTMMGSALNYVALRLLGEGPDDGNGAVARGRTWVLDHGGATGIPSWGKTFLSVLGVYKWDGCNPLPPEFWLFPSFFPFHPAKMLCFCRTTYMPMSYLYGRKYHGPLTDLVLSLRQEIHLEPYDQIDWNKARHDCCKEDLYYPHTYVQDLLWDTLHYLSEPLMRRWPLKWLRQKSMEKTIKHMRYGAENSRYICSAVVEKSLQMMCWWAHDPDGIEFKHHLARVPDYIWLAEDGMTMQASSSQLWDSAFATQAIIATGMMEEYGDCLKKAHFFIKESQIKDNPSGDYKGMYRHFTKGGWTFSDQDQGWVVSDSTAEALKCLLMLSQLPTEIAGEKPDDERLHEAVNVLLYLQSPLSGGFSVWEPPIPQPYLEVLNPSEILGDLVVEQEYVECTASVIEALLSFKCLHPNHRKIEIEMSVANGLRYLEEKQLPDGSWYGYWGICFLYGTFFALRGFAAAGKTYKNSAAVRKGVDFILSIQNEEGGWGESFESCPSMGRVIPLREQIGNFKNTLDQLRGQMQTEDLSRYLAKAVAFVNMGANDYLSYIIKPTLYRSSLIYSPQEYADLLIKLYTSYILEIQNLGLRKFMILEIAPIGCIPILISDKRNHSGECDERPNHLVQMFNSRLKPMVDRLNGNNPGSVFTVVAGYDVLTDLRNNGDAYGITVKDKACCVLGGPKSIKVCLPNVEPCYDREQYLFWDEAHPTDAACRIIVSRVFNSSTYCYPVTIQKLVEM